MADKIRRDDDIDEDVIDLRPYIIAVLRYAPLIVLAGIVGAVLGYVMASRATPVYEAHAQMLVVIPQKAADNTFKTAKIADIGTVLLDNQDLAAQVIKDLALDAAPYSLVPSTFYTRLTVSRVGTTNAIAVSARQPDAAMAAKTVNAFCERALEAVKRINEDEVLVIKQQLDYAQQRLAEAQAKLAAASQGEKERARLQTEYGVEEKIYAEVASRYERVRINNLAHGAQLQVTDRAALPANPVSPRPRRTTMAGGVVGVILAITGVVLYQAARGSRPGVKPRAASV